MRNTRVSWIDIMILGILSSVITVELIYVAVIFVGNSSFGLFATLSSFALALMLIAIVVVGVMSANGEKKKNMVVIKNDGHKIAAAQFPLYAVAAGAVILFQIIWNYYLQEPYRETDIMAETVQSMLSDGSIHQMNPMTGSAYTAGMPLRLKLLVLPALYAAIVKWTGLPVQTVLYEIIPMFVLIFSYLIYSRLAVYLFPGQGRKQCIFMFLTALIYQFGDYAPVTESFRVLHTGYSGESIRAAVILPFALLACLKRKWWQACLCIIVEACIVWTLYGMGYTVIIVLVSVCVYGISYVLKRRGI